MKKLYTYIGLVILSFFIFSVTRLNASTIVYNYDDEFIIENHKSEFFGESGYLEQLRLLVDQKSTSASWQIYFSKNNLCVYELFYNSNYGKFMSPMFNIVSSDTDSYSDVVFSANNLVYSYCLNDYNSFDAMKESVISANGVNNGVPLYERIINNQPFLTDTIDYFDIGFTDYVIPYYYHNGVARNIISTFFTAVGDTSDTMLVNGTHSSSVLAHTASTFGSPVEVFPSYYDLYGYNEPSSSIEPETSSFQIYNNAFIIDYDNLNKSSSSFSFKVVDSVSPTISSVEFYGLVNDNGLMHYELLPNDYITKFNYTTSFVNRIFTFSFDVNSFIYTDFVYDQYLSKFEKIYVKINYENPVKYNKSSYTETLGLSSQIVLNDVCSECLFLQLDSSGRNTYMFSANKDFDSSKIYFSDVIGNDFLYNEFAYVDLSSNILLDNTVNYISRQYFYGSFNKVLFDNIKLSLSTGLVNNLYMLAVADDKDVNKDYNFGYSRSYQMLYFITPNIYWGNGVYNDNRDSLSGSYVDKDGNHQDFTISGDFTNKRSDLVNSTGISGFFKSAFEKGKEFVNCGVEILSLVTSLFNSFPVSVQSLILLIFFISLIIVLIKFIS